MRMNVVGQESLNRMALRIQPVCGALLCASSSFSAKPTDSLRQRESGVHPLVELEDVLGPDEGEQTLVGPVRG